MVVGPRCPKKTGSRIYQNWKPAFTDFDYCFSHPDTIFAKEENNICTRN